MQGQDMQQVCLNGHKITDFLLSQPSSGKEFCTECGAKTISKCQNCGFEIKGYLHVDGTFSFNDTPIPKHCEKCGTAFPWTPKKNLTESDLVETQINLAKQKFRDDSRRADQEATRKLIHENVDRSLRNSAKENKPIKKSPISWIKLTMGLTASLAITVTVAVHFHFSKESTQNISGKNNLSVQNSGGAVINNFDFKTYEKDEMNTNIKLRPVLDQLAGFYQTGDRVKGECTDPNKEYSLKKFQNDYQEWMKNTRNFLRSNPELGGWYSVQFDERDQKDEPGDRTPPSTAPKDRSDSYPDIVRRMENLQYFGDQLSRK